MSQAITIMREKKDFLILLVLPLLTYLIFVFFMLLARFDDLQYTGIRRLDVTHGD